MAESQVLAIEPQEDESEHEDDKERGTEETHDEAEVWAVWRVLFNIHKAWMRRDATAAMECPSNFRTKLGLSLDT